MHKTCKMYTKCIHRPRQDKTRPHPL